MDYRILLTTTGDAVEDILRNPRFEGAMNTIGWLTSFIDQYFVMLISVMSLFIIGVALLRNVMAGAYAAYPKFWDKVSNAKAALEGKLNSSGGMGAVGATILSWLPDVKEMSDFSDDTVSPKHYFIVAIPKMFALVLIGVFIYNGYYRDLTVKTSQFGSIMFQRFILAVKPEEVIDRVVANVYQPKVQASLGKDSKSKYVSRLSKEAYASIVSKFSDITDNTAKDQLMGNIESAMWDFVDAKGVKRKSEIPIDNLRPSLFEDEKYKVSTGVSISTKPYSSDAAFSGDTVDNFMLIRNYKIREDFGIDSLVDKNVDYYLIVSSRLQRKADKQVNTVDNNKLVGVLVLNSNWRSSKESLSKMDTVTLVYDNSSIPLTWKVSSWTYDTTKYDLKPNRVYTVAKGSDVRRVNTDNSNVNIEAKYVMFNDKVSAVDLILKPEHGTEIQKGIKANASKEAFERWYNEGKGDDPNKP